MENIPTFCIKNHLGCVTDLRKNVLKKRKRKGDRVGFRSFGAALPGR